jgi:hypothetical protein
MMPNGRGLGGAEEVSLDGFKLEQRRGILAALQPSPESTGTNGTVDAITFEGVLHATSAHALGPEKFLLSSDGMRQHLATLQRLPA